MISQTKCIEWDFPLPRTHTGILAGNGRMGAIIWGTENRLNITVGRADFWDHRGGMLFTPEHNAEHLFKLLNSHDSAAVDRLFRTVTSGKAGEPLNPSLIPVGHAEFDLGENTRLKKGFLTPATGEIRIVFEKEGKEDSFRICHSMRANALLIFGSFECKTTIVPAWDIIKKEMQAVSFSAPERFREHNLSGFIQSCPADPALCFLCCSRENSIILATGRSSEKSDARADAEFQVNEIPNTGTTRFIAENETWWRQYWADTPELSLPDDELEEIYLYNMYKFGIMTNPAGVPAGLQGPWIEDYRMPKWAADYHFNINVQMNYFPALKANKAENLRRMFDMVWENRERFRHNAEMFLQIPDGYLLPHSTDDRGVCMGRYWSGNTDPACGGWIAAMMFDYVRYTGDLSYLQETVFPFLKGTMRIYEKLLVRTEHGYELPAGVSPEWNANYIQPECWGINASYQLACIHRLCTDLTEAASLLGIPPEPQWAEIRNGLPLFDIEDDYGKPLIGIWKGQKPTVSHRHHSHLAALFPFDTVDIYQWKDLIQYTIHYWVAKGPGFWAGWSYPWAAIIHTRIGNGDGAEMLLKIWNRFFTNEGRGTTHDAFSSTFSANTLVFSKKDPLPVTCDSDFYILPPEESEIMQIESGMGAAAAIQEMLLHSRCGIVTLFPAIPKKWKNVSFRNIACEGGFKISAKLSNGKLEKLTVESTRDNVLKLTLPGDSSDILELKMSAGEIREIFVQ